MTDGSWSPHNSSVFALTTVDGKASCYFKEILIIFVNFIYQVHVYDLSVNKYSPICSQAIVNRKKARLNHISFNTVHPVIIVGDSAGVTHSLKLSPNLRFKYLLGLYFNQYLYQEARKGNFEGSQKQR